MKKLLLFFTITLCTNFCVAQQNYIANVQYFGVEQGLPHRDITCVNQDSLGFIWIGTTRSGLVRFDGHHFKVFNSVEYPFQSDVANLILKDANGWFWVIGGKGVGEFTPLTLDQINIFNPYTFEVKTLQAYLKGKFPKDALSKIDLIYQHSDGTIFIDIINGSPFEFHPKFGLKTSNINQKKYAEKQEMAYRNANIPNPIYPNIQALYYNKNPYTGNLWFSLRGQNYFFVANEKDGIIYDFKKDYPEIVNNTIADVFFDNQKNAWVATEFGLYKIRLHQSPFQRLLNVPLEKYTPATAFSCRAISVTNDEIWVNSNLQKQFIVNQKTDKKRLVIPNFNDILVPILKVSENEYYSASRVLYHLKYGKIDKIYPWKNQDNLVNWAIFQASDKQIYLGTDGQGLAVLKNDSLVLYEKYNEFDALKTALVGAFLKWNDELTLLVSSNGLFVMHRKKGIIHQLKSDNPKYNNFYYLHIYRDKTEKNVLWCGTAQGLVRLTIDEKNWKVTDFQRFSIENGLADNMIYAVYEDKNNNLWLPSDYGIICFNKTNYHSKSYTVRDGVSFNEFNRISHFQDKNGRLYFGSMNGLTVFNPDEVLKIQQDFNVAFRIVDFQQFDGKDNKIKDKTQELLQQNKIVLQPNDKFFNLTFSLLEYVDATHIKYSYRIKGQSDDWLYLNDNQLRISGLPYGKHILEVRSQGVSGQFSTQQLTIPIVVLRPFYLQIWFVVTLISLLLFGVYYWYKHRTQQLIIQKNILEEKVEERTAQIQKDKTTIEKQAEELKNLDKLKSKFFANISHELRTPLTLMLAPIEDTIERNQLTNRDFTNLQLVKRNGNRLQKMINEILDLTKLESGKLELRPTRVVWYNFLKSHLAGFESLADIKHLEYQFIYTGNEYLQLNLDKQKIEIIIANLLSNAFKFTEKGKIIFKSNVSDGLLTLTVEDSGRGIHADDLPNIFNRFYQTKNKNTAAEGGTGIGLSLTNELVTLMNGEMTVKSEWGKGTVFIVKIPVIEVFGKLEDAAVLEKEFLENKSNLDTRNISETIDNQIDKTNFPTILLVEDNADLSFFIKSLLADFYHVETAENGQKALEKLSTINCQLILSDVMMPIMDGLQLLQKVKSNPKTQQLPFILLTARTAMEDKLNALRIGVDDYLTKPFVKEELLVRIENLLQNAVNRQLAIQENDTETDAENEVSTPEISAATQEWIDELAQQIMANIDKVNFTIDDLADTMNVSKRQIYRLINEHIGQTPHQYLKTFRLSYARQLLENQTVDSVKAVAYSVGFPNVVYFSRQFKNEFGRLPSEYL